MENNNEMDISADLKTVNEDDKDLILAILGSVNDPDFGNWDLWDIVPKLSQYLSRDKSLDSKNLNSLSQRAINEIASVGNPKEFILNALLQLEENFDDFKFCALLKPLGCALTRLNDEHGKSLEWCLNSIVYSLRHLHRPEDSSLEGEELPLDSDGFYLIVCKVYEELLEFYQLIQSKILNPLKLDVKNSEKLEKFNGIFAMHLLKILGSPIIYLNLEVDSSETRKSRIRKLVENLVNNIFSVSNDVLSYFGQIDAPPDQISTTLDRTELVPCLSAANFYYLIFCEKIGPVDKIPKVYSLCHLRLNLFPLATALVSNLESSIRRKGLLLTNFMFLELDCNFNLEATLIEPLMQGLINCIIYEKSEENRKLGFSVFKNYFCKLNAREKYLVFLNLRGLISNSSLAAHVIMCIKDTLIENYRHPLFSHKYLFDLINLYCKLRDGATPDLMASANEIIAALNFIRFLIIRDKSNELGIFKYLENIREILLNPLVEALKLSRAQWQLELNEIGNETVVDDSMSLTVSGKNLPKMPKEEQIKVVDSAFNCIDLLESLTARVIECISEISINQS